MFNSTRSRVRALAVVGMVAVTAGVAAVTYQASAAEVTAGRAAPATQARQTRLSGNRFAVPAIPDALKPPAGSRPIGIFSVSTGTQNYTCVVSDGATTGAFTGASVPEAQLTGDGGEIHHFAGPSWQSEDDGSLVTATKVASSARDGAVPELLLQVASHSGSGILSDADFINRVATEGGVAPTDSCTAGQTADVPYTAVYVFWDAP